MSPCDIKSGQIGVIDPIHPPNPSLFSAVLCDGMSNHFADTDTMVLQILLFKGIKPELIKQEEDLKRIEIRRKKEKRELKKQKRINKNAVKIIFTALHFSLS